MLKLNKTIYQVSTEGSNPDSYNTVAILFSGVEPFDRRLHVQSGENWSSSFREDVQRLHDFKHVILLRGKGL